MYDPVSARRAFQPSSGIHQYLEIPENNLAWTDWAGYLLSEFLNTCQGKKEGKCPLFSRILN